MTRVDEFDHFYSSTSDTTLKATYAVCGDRNVAFEATVDAYRHAWRDWGKIRNHRPDGWVRTEAWRLTALSRSTHPLRQRHEEDADRELLGALAKIRIDDRRLIALLTLGSVDLEDACREVGVPAQQGAESVTTALGGLETTLGEPLDQVEERMHGLSRVTRTLTLPAAGVVRHRAQLGRRRNTILLIAATIAITLGGGLVSANDNTTTDRHRIGDKLQDPVLLAQKLDAEDLLQPRQVSAIDPKLSWHVLNTNDDLGETTPYATCPPRRFSDGDAVRGWVRTFQAGKTEERVVQAVEVSRNSDTALRSFRRQQQWYGDCRLPGVQLSESWIVRRVDPDFRILQLASHQDPEQTFTVGIGISGSVVTTVVHRSAGDEGPNINTFARVLSDAMEDVCDFGSRRCGPGLSLRKAPPPATTRNPAFLAIADLPPIGDATGLWSGVASDPKTRQDAAVCDKPDFTGARASSRVYIDSTVSKEADKKFRAFGVNETVGHFPDEDAAKAFLQDVEKNLKRCPKKNLAAQVDQETAVNDGSIEVTTWRVKLDLPDGGRAQYRTSVVRNGSAVAHVTFTPVGNYELRRSVFEALAFRAGQRLAY